METAFADAKSACLAGSPTPGLGAGTQLGTVFTGTTVVFIQSRILKLFTRPGIYSKEPIPPGCVA
jgi:hypothetical protein